MSKSKFITKEKWEAFEKAVDKIADLKIIAEKSRTFNPFIKKIFEDSSNTIPKPFCSDTRTLEWKAAKKCELTDITFDVGGTTFNAHKYKLLLHGKYFTKLLNSPFSEENKREKLTKTFKINEIDPIVFKSLLKIIYTRKLTKSFKQAVQHRKIDLLELIEKSQLFDIGGYTEEILNLISEMDSKELLFSVLFLALAEKNQKLGNVAIGVLTACYLKKSINYNSLVETLLEVTKNISREKWEALKIAGGIICGVF